MRKVKAKAKFEHNGRIVNVDDVMFVSDERAGELRDEGKVIALEPEREQPTPPED